MANYTWTTSGNALVDGANTTVGKSEFGQNQNNGNRMQPDAYYSDMFLERKRFKADELVFANFAETREIKKGLDTINLRRYQPLKAHIVPLVEGLPPTADRANGKAIIAKTRQYGRYMEFTDQFDYKVADPVIEEYTMELADLANETIDMLAQAALLAEAQVFFPIASGAATKDALALLAAGNTATPATDASKKKAQPTFEDLRVIKLTMEAAKVKPINGVYIVLASPAVYFDLQSSVDEKTLVNYMNYGQTNAPMTNDSIPTMYGISVRKAHTAHVESVTASGDGGNKANIHHTIMLGAKAYTKVTIGGSGGVEWFKQGLGSAGTLDPLHQRRTMGWKISNLGFKVTDPDAVVDYMSIPSQSDIVFGDFDYVTTAPASIGISDEMAQAKIKGLESGAGSQLAASAVAIVPKDVTVDSSARELVKNQFGTMADPKLAAKNIEAKEQDTEKED